MDAPIRRPFCPPPPQTLVAKVEKHDGDVVVIGDVNKDSTVSAGGDVAVFGRLSGEVHAGNKGDTSATVSAICFEPSQIRIADVVAVMGAQSSEPTPYPEVARIEYSGPGQGLPTSRGGSPGKGRIMVEPAGQFWQQLSARGRKRKAARMSSGGKLKWTAPAKSARLTGLYLLVAGISLIAAPKSTFGKNGSRGRNWCAAETSTHRRQLHHCCRRSNFADSRCFPLSLSPFRETKGLLFDVRTIATGWIQVFGAIAAALGMYCEYCLCGTPPARLFSVIAADLSTFVMLVR